MSMAKEYDWYNFVASDTVRETLESAKHDADSPSTILQISGDSSIRGARTEDILKIVELAEQPSDTVPAYRVANAALFEDHDEVLDDTDHEEKADFLVLDVQVVVDLQQRSAFSEPLAEAVENVLSARIASEEEVLEREMETVLDTLAELTIQRVELEKKLAALDTQREKLQKQ